MLLFFAATLVFRAWFEAGWRYGFAVATRRLVGWALAIRQEIDSRRDRYRRESEFLAGQMNLVCQELVEDAKDIPDESFEASCRRRQLALRRAHVSLARLHRMQESTDSCISSEAFLNVLRDYLARPLQ